jgi:tetraacyldisaccharide 4'-kinase
MRAPDFWDEPPGLASGLLAPVGAVIDAAGRMRRALAHPFRTAVPVICVGTLVVGGAGKTPVVLALADLLSEHGLTPHVVMRGYGGRLRGPVRVDPAVHDAASVGDEAFLAAAYAPCWVARDRADGVRKAVAAGATTVLLDDGFQNPSVAKDLSLLVVDAAYGFGNGRLLPAGPLRERVDAGLARADAIVLLDGDGMPSALEGSAISVLRAELAPTDGERFAGKRVVAFAGIGRPGKFFATLRRLSADVAAEFPFPDHHPFSDADIAVLRDAAGRERALAVTTEKDWVRLSPDRRAGIEFLAVEIRWRDAGALMAVLAPVLKVSHADGG